ncbi:MAG: class I SAM-dependent methyltransferase [Planctomycetes bacterium]|nr:class I SAM-dependent methyltransferase [Planctomycetota bacterium]
MAVGKFSAHLFRVTALLLLMVPVSGCAQHEQSVRPGVNKEFEGEVKVEEWVARFEGESREIYSHRDAIIAAMELKSGMSVADIGAGTGFFTMMFADRVGPSGAVYAVDIADEFVRHIEEGARQRNLKNIHPVLCKTDSVELPAKSVDVAFICDTYHHFEFPKSTTKSLRNAMRPGGVVYVIDFIRIEGKSRDWILEHVRAGEEVFAEEIESVGFKREPLNADTPFLKENYMLKFRRN